MADKFRAIYSVPAQRGFPIDEASRYLGMHPQTLRKLTDTGEIPCRRVGRHRVFLLEDLNAWLEAQPPAVVPEPPPPAPPAEAISIELSQFSAKACIYFLTLKGRVVYVGQTRFLAHRIGEHIKRRRELFDGACYLECAAGDLYYLEGYYIQRYKPELNRIMPCTVKIDSENRLLPMRIKGTEEGK